MDEELEALKRKLEKAKRKVLEWTKKNFPIETSTCEALLDEFIREVTG